MFRSCSPCFTTNRLELSRGAHARTGPERKQFRKCHSAPRHWSFKTRPPECCAPHLPAARSRRDAAAPPALLRRPLRRPPAPGYSVWTALTGSLQLANIMLILGGTVLDGGFPLIVVQILVHPQDDRGTVDLALRLVGGLVLDVLGEGPGSVFIARFEGAGFFRWGRTLRYVKLHDAVS